MRIRVTRSIVGVWKIFVDPAGGNDFQVQASGIDNTFNTKPDAKRFCIPLDKDLIYAGDAAIIERAKQQNFKSNWYGSKTWDISKFDRASSQYNGSLHVEEISVDNSQINDKLPSITPECVRHILETGGVGFHNRFPVLLFLRDNCYTIQEALAILKNYLSKERYKHVVFEDRQPRHIYSKEGLFFPRHEKMVDEGMCPFESGYCKNCKHGCMNYGRT